MTSVANANTLANAWDETTLLRVEEANELFANPKTRPNPATAREADYGTAVTLLNIQPRTPGNIEHSAQIFSRLLAQNPDDEIGIGSLYFLARIEQVHRSTPAPQKAVALYQRLIAAHPAHPFAQIAITKIALLKLCDAPDNADKAAALAEVETLIPLLTDPGARSNFDYIVGTACIRHQLGDEKAMNYLIEAVKIGIPIQISSSNAIVRIANLALRLNRKDIAISYYERFIRDFPRDRRTYTVRLRLRELNVQSPEVAR